MNVFTFDEVFYFQRQPYDDCWYAYRHPGLNLADSETFAHGYFNVADGRFVRTPQDGRDFGPQEVRRIERILSEHVHDMLLEQFNVHVEIPGHYKELKGETNRFADLQSRCRAIGICDPEFSVAFQQLTDDWPAYRLTREFVTSVLERAGTVSKKSRNEWLHEALKDMWMYDVSPYAQPGETFESFYDTTPRGLLVPKPPEQRMDTKYRIFEIEQLPSVYLFAEETELPNFDTPMTSSCHYRDRDSAVVPIPLPSHGGQAYYVS